MGSQVLKEHVPMHAVHRLNGGGLNWNQLYVASAIVWPSTGNKRENSQPASAALLGCVEVGSELLLPLVRGSWTDTC